MTRHIFLISFLLIITFQLQFCTQNKENNTIWTNPLDTSGYNYNPPQITSPSNTLQAEVNNPVNIALSSTLNHSKNKYYWKTENENSWNVTKKPQKKFTFHSSGTKTVLVYAKDTLGLFSDTAEIEVMIKDYRPEITNLDSEYTGFARKEISVPVTAEYRLEANNGLTFLWHLQDTTIIHKKAADPIVEYQTFVKVSDTLDLKYNSPRKIEASVKVKDFKNRVGKTDSFYININKNNFTISQISDLYIPINNEASVNITTVDPDNRITKYFWDINANNKNYIFSEKPEHTFKPVTVKITTIRYGVILENDQEVSDTFKVYPTTKPDSCWIEIKNKSQIMNNNTQTANIHFHVKDRDTLYDHHDYTFFFNEKTLPLNKIYQGGQDSITLQKITNNHYKWKLKVRDSFNNTVTDSGEITF